MAIFLGIDGGGSKTTCAVADESRLLGCATTAGSNVVRLGEERARTALHSAICEACNAAGVDLRDIAATCVGAAGAASPAVAQSVRGMVAEIVAGEVQVVGDMVIALEAAFAGGAGVIVIAGTGSIAYGRNQRGETARAGGWGWAISDEGSAHWIGRSAVSAVLRALDAGEKTDLLRRMMEFWAVLDPKQLAAKANAVPPANFADLFPCVLSAASDDVAANVLRDAGIAMAKLAAIVARKLWPAGESVRVALAGGVFDHAELVRTAFRDWMEANCTRATLACERIEPVQGALFLARQLVGTRS